MMTTSKSSMGTPFSSTACSSSTDGTRMETVFPPCLATFRLHDHGLVVRNCLGARGLEAEITRSPSGCPDPTAGGSRTFGLTDLAHLRRLTPSLTIPRPTHKS